MQVQISYCGRRNARLEWQLAEKIGAQPIEVAPLWRWKFRPLIEVAPTRSGWWSVLFEIPNQRLEHDLIRGPVEALEVSRCDGEVLIDGVKVAETENT
jgi:hypothetical protein